VLVEEFFKLVELVFAELWNFHMQVHIEVAFSVLAGNRHALALDDTNLTGLDYLFA